MATQPKPRFEKIALAIAPPIARLTLSNPPVNVLDVPMMDELLAAVEEVEQRSDVAAIVLSGNQRAFSAGVDVKAHTPDKVRDMLVKFHSVIRAVTATKKVSIAAVRGTCMGGGAELAAVCDIVYNPLDTPLLKSARARGHICIDGLGMLMHQAVPAFAAFYGVTPSVTPALRAELEQALTHG